MSLRGFDDLYGEADLRRPEVGVVVAGGADATVLVAMAEASRRGWVKPILVGGRERIEQMASELSVTLDGFEVIHSEAPAVTACEAVHSGKAKFVMKGQIPTPDLMRAVLDKERGLRTGRPIAQVVLMEILRDQRRFLLSDTGIAISLPLDKKKALIAELTCIGRQLLPPGEMSELKIAVMCASEKQNEAMPETIHAAELAALSQQGEFPGAIVDGPLSFDLAYAQEAGSRKGLASSVVGAADAMLFHDLLSANLTVKAIMYTADCRFGGLLAGTLAPVVFMSRADSVETRLNSLALTLAVYGGGS